MQTAFTKWLKDNGYELWHARLLKNYDDLQYIKVGIPYSIDSLIKEYSAQFSASPTEGIEAMAEESKKLKIAIKALKDIRDWDDDMEDKWEDAGYRAISALNDIEAAAPPINTDKK